MSPTKHFLITQLFTLRRLKRFRVFQILTMIQDSRLPTAALNELLLLTHTAFSCVTLGVTFVTLRVPCDVIWLIRGVGCEWGCNLKNSYLDWSIATLCYKWNDMSGLGRDKIHAVHP